MKIKQATQLAIIGVILQIIPQIMYFLVTLNVLKWVNLDTGAQYWYLKYIGILPIIGGILILSFFVTLFKNQE